MLVNPLHVKARKSLMLLTVLFMQLCYLEGILPALVEIIIAFIPSRHGRQLRARESGQRMQIQPVQNKSHIVEGNRGDDALPQ